MLETENNDIIQREPFRFGQAIFKPFLSGPASLGFIVKSMLLYAIALTFMLMLFGKLLVGPMEDYVKIMIEMENTTNEEESMELMMKMFSSMGKMILPYFIITLGTWTVWASIEAALHRRVLLNEYGGLFPFRFKGDELRVMLAHLILYFTYQGLYMVVYIAGIIAVAVVALLANFTGSIGAVIGGIIATALVIAGFGFMVWVLVRLAPTAALSVYRKNFAIGEAWPVVKGRIWPSVGAYAFHYIIGMIVLYAVLGVLFWLFLGSAIIDIFAGLGGDDTKPAELWQNFKDTFSQSSVKTGLIAITFISGMLFALWMLLIAGIMSHVTSLYLKDQDKQRAEVFS